MSIQLYRLSTSADAPPGASPSPVDVRRRTVTWSTDQSPIAESHRGVGFDVVETWTVDTVEEAGAIRSMHATDDSRWITTRRHVVLNGAPLTEVDSGIGIKLIVGMCRHEDMSVDTFQRHWLDEHAELTLEAPGTSRYEITLPVADEYLAGEPSYDGFAELWWRSQADLDAYLASPVMAKVGADMEIFVSPTRPLWSLYSSRGERWF